MSNSKSKQSYKKSKGRKGTNYKAQVESVPSKSGKFESSNSDIRYPNRVNMDSERSNNIEWWNKAKYLYEEAVRVPFNRIMGDSIPYNKLRPHSVFEGWIDYTNNSAIPGVMTIEYIPGIGKSTDSFSQVNRAFTSLYGDIYSKTTGAMQFQQADLAMLVLSVASICQNIALAKRLIGLSTDYAYQNYYYPISIYHALDAEPYDIIGHTDELRSRLNTLIESLNKMAIPNFVDLFKRQYSMALNIYADEDNIQAQLYAFIPDGYYVYHDTATSISDVSHLEYVRFADHNINTILDAIEQQTLAWRNSSDLGIISGSIQRAFGMQDLISVEFINSSYRTIPTFDKNLSYQINNLTFVGHSYKPETMHVTQDPVKNTILYDPKWNYDAASSGATCEAFILNSHNNDTSDEFIMEATRLITVLRDVDETTREVVVSGTEIVTRMFITTNEFKSGELSYHQLGYVGGICDLSTDNFKAYSLTELSKFRNHPRIALMETETGESGNTFNYYGFIGDLYVYTIVDTDMLKGLMNAALQSLYVVNVPLKL